MYFDIKNGKDCSIDVYKREDLGTYVMDIETKEKKVTLTFKDPEEMRIMYDIVKKMIDNDHLLNTEKRFYFEVDA